MRRGTPPHPRGGRRPVKARGGQAWPPARHVGSVLVGGAQGERSTGPRARRVVGTSWWNVSRHHTAQALDAEEPALHHVHPGTTASPKGILHTRRIPGEVHSPQDGLRPKDGHRHYWVPRNRLGHRAVTSSTGPPGQRALDQYEGTRTRRIRPLVDDHRGVQGIDPLHRATQSAR